MPINFYNQAGTGNIRTTSAGLGGSMSLTKASLITSSLFIWYDFGTGSCYPGTGTSVFDLSGNIGTGGVSGSPAFTYGANGFFTFTGSLSTYITTNNTGSALSVSGFTVQIIASTPNVASRSALIDHSAAVLPPGWLLEIGTINSTYNINGTRFSASDNTNQIEADSSYNISNNTIYLFTSTWNNSSKTGTTYVNINPVASSTIAAETAFDNTQTIKFGVGYGKTVGSYTNQYVILVYSASLSPAQIAQNYYHFRDRFGLP